MYRIDRAPRILDPDLAWEVGLRVAEYLTACQVVAPDVRVEMLPTDDPVDGTRSGVLTVRELRGDPGPVEYRLVTRPGPSGSRRVWVESVSHPVGVAGPFDAGSYLRLFQGRLLHAPTTTYRVEPESNYTRRLAAKYARLMVAELRRLSVARARRILEGVRDLARYYVDRRHRVASAVRFENVPGITWQLSRVEDDGVEMTCYDRGGILDFHTNSEGDELPPQVMGTVYADAYAAWALAFAHQARPTPSSADAAHDAAEFLARVYPGYAASMTPMTHADFKNAGLLETLTLSGRDMEPSLRTTLEAHARSLRADLYLPTNVYALRHHWRTAQSVGGYGELSVRERRGLTRRVGRDLLDDGLIQDNNPGRFYFDSHDLTYHQYSLACLADSLRLADDEETRSILLAGVDFTIAMETPDGEVSYMGRGSNNVYHLASAISALRFAARLVGDADPERAARYRRGARLALAYLSRAQRADGMLATAVNPEIERRMAWNHCHTPYNALSAYYLLRAATDEAALAADPHAIDPETVRLPMESPPACRLHASSGYLVVVTSGYYAVLFAGCERSYSWSSENHFTGAPGLAMIGIPGHGALHPILDGVVTDHPFSGEDPTGAGRLRLVGESPPVAELVRERRQHWVFLDEGIVVITRGRPGGAVLRVPARADPPWRSSVSSDAGRPGVDATDGSVGLAWRVHHVSGGLDPIFTRERHTNPRGFVDLHLVGRATDSDGNVVAVTSVTPGAGSPAPLDVDVRDSERGLVIRCGARTITDREGVVTVE